MKFPVCFLITMLLQNAAANDTPDFSVVIKDYESYIKNTKDLCSVTSNADPKMVDDLLKNGIFFEDENLKKYMACIYLYLGIVNPEGIINKDTVIEYVGVDDSKIKEVIYRMCSYPKGRNVTDIVWNLIKCIFKTVQSLN
ncbi:hypothetical protein FQA39_LY08021 [Lamprigera yunnana]|nr:hypothetical protein FQA39_LY08021 [Lamprigera yunnana]